MSNFLLVVEGLMADGADAAMIVDETTFRGAVLGCIFEEPCTGYIWCDKHGWTPADEACICDDCAWEVFQA